MQNQPVIKQAIRIQMAGTVTSFRYPHFTQGVHPTFEMPPPSTIYGHICSAVGDWVPPEILEFGYRFTHSGKFVDYKEHLHFSDPIQPFPFDRELLFQPRLTLYITPVDLIDAFQRPHFAVNLGRSQDLMTYTEVKVVPLHKASIGYFEHTILPLSMAPRLGGETIAMTMARYIDPRRRAAWGTYTLLRDAAIFPPPKQARSKYDDDEEDSGLVMEGDEGEIELWIDLDSPPHRKHPEVRRAIWFHRFVDRKNT